MQVAQCVPTRVPTVRVSRSRTVRVNAMATTDKLKVYVKGEPATGVLLDCPFCQRVLLTCEIKHVPYEREYIDFAAKPDWLQERSGGKVPLVNDGDFWLADSDEIVKWLETTHPTPSMVSTVPADVVGGVFGAFRGALTATEGEAAAKVTAFEAELEKINAYLAANGPYLGGSVLDSTDASTAPKLYHAFTALGHYKGWSLDAARFPALAAYWAALTATPEWKATEYGTDTIVKGWAKVFA